MSRIFLPILAVLLGLAATAALPAAASPALQDTCDAAIHGMVTGADGTAVEGATVFAARAATAINPGGDPNAPRLETSTDEDGAYHFDDLCDGRYMLVAMYTNAAGERFVGVHDADQDGEPDLVALNADTRIAENIDIVLEAAPEEPNQPDPGPRPPGTTPRQCEIDDGSIAGVVTDLDGDAVAGARVTAMHANRSPSGSAIGVAEHSVSTDADGAYVFEGMCEGRYLVMAQHRTPAGALMGWYDADGDGTRDLVPLSADDRVAVDIDIVLDQKWQEPNPPDQPSPGPAPAPRQCAIDDGSIAGVVTNVDGDAVEGARVVAVMTTMSAAGNVVGSFARGVSTDADGAYVIEGLCEGRYEVVAQHRTTNEAVMGWYDADGDGTRDLVPLSEDDRVAVDINIVLDQKWQEPNPPDQPSPGPAPAPRQCAIDDGSIAGVVTNVDGDAVEGAYVFAFEATASGRPPATVSYRPVRTDVDGRYLIEGLCEGRYFVEAQLRSSTGALRGMHDADAVGGPDMVPLSEQTRDAADIDIVLDQKVSSPNVPGPRPAPIPPGRPEPPVAPQCRMDDGAVSGRILDADDQPVAGARVLVVPAGPVAVIGGTGGMPVPALPVESDADGAYSVTGLCEGRYQIVAFAQTDTGMQIGFYDADRDGAPDTVPLSVNAPTAVDVDVHLIAMPAPGLPDNGRTLPLPRPAPLPLPPISSR